MLEKFTKKFTKEAVAAAKEEIPNITPYALMGFALLAGIVGLLDAGKPLPPVGANHSQQINIYKF